MRYNYIDTYDETVNQIIRQFDKQIKIEYKQFKGKKEDCPSYWHKLIFIETLDLETYEWKSIRGKDYFKTKSELNGVDIEKFILQKIKDYKSKQLTNNFDFE
jgi:hypothetical protein